MANPSPGDPPPPPFPWLPMLAIAVGLVSHSYSLSSLFPYVGYMVQHLGVTDDKDEAGYYAGYLSSALMVGRFAFSYFWGRFADRYGRLPVLYIGLSSIAIFSVGFGLSTSFWWAIACRFLLGAMNGVVAIGKCMISEVCGKEHEAVGMSFITTSWSVGLVFGPALGGLLSETTDSGLFGRFPYLLPNILGASLALSGLPMVFFFLKETTNFDNDDGSGDSRAGFKPLPTSDNGDADVDMEEGRVSSLEMTPLTQANSLDDGNQDGGHDSRDGEDGEDALAALLEGSLDESALSTTATTGEGGGDGGDEGCAPSDAAASVSNRIGTRAHASGSGGNSGNGLLMDDKCEEVQGETRGAAVWREFLVPVQLLREKRVRAILFVYCFYSFACIGWGEVYPLWALSTVANGGLDWETDQIGKCIDMGVDSLYPLWAISSIESGGLDWSTENVGQVLSLCGMGMLTFQLLLYPRMSKRMGVTKTQRIACLLAIPVYMAFPLLSNLRDSEVPLVVASFIFNFLNNVTATAIFINTALATNNAVDPSRRATVNGLSMAMGSIAKAAGPAFFSAIFAWSIDGPGPRPFPLDYHLVFYVLALSMAVVSWVSWSVITDNPPPPTQPAGVRAPGTRG